MAAARGLARLSQLSRHLCPNSTLGRVPTTIALPNLKPVSPLLLAQPVRQFAEEARKEGGESEVQQAREGQVHRGRRRHDLRPRGFWDEFESFFNDPFFRAFERSVLPRRVSEAFEGVWSPSVDICETKDSYVVHAELPGLKKEDVTIKIDDGVLTIQGERKFEAEKSDKNYYRVERSYGTFLRSFQLPEDVDPDKVKAVFKDGVLEITMTMPVPAKLAEP